MSKPQLPPIAPSFERPYKFSGKCPRSSLVTIVAAGILSGALIGAIGYFGGLLVGPLVGLLETFALTLDPDDWGPWPYLAVLLAAVLIGPLYTLLVGAALGVLTFAWVNGAKCRSPAWTVGAGVIHAVAAYAIVLLLSVLRSGGVHTLSGAERNLEWIATSPWRFAFIALDLLLLAAPTIWIGWAAMKDERYCERCGEWYAPAQQRTFGIRLARLLAKTLESGPARDLGTVEQVRDTEFPHLAVKMRRCAKCDVSDFELEVRVAWEEEERQRFGRTKVEQKDEQWLKTMVAPELGIQMERVLFAKDLPVAATGDALAGEPVPRVWTVEPEAREQLVGPYRAAIDGLTDGQLIEIKPEPGDTLQALATRVRWAAYEAGRAIEYGETGEGTLLVWPAAAQPQ